MVNRIRVVIDGDSRGLERAADRSGRAVRRVGEATHKSAAGVGRANDMAGRSTEKAAAGAEHASKRMEGSSRRAAGGFGLLRRGAGSLTGVLIGGAGLGAAMRYVSENTAEQLKVAAQTDAVLRSTAGAAGVQRKEIEGLAMSLARKTGVDDEQIQASENLMLTFTKVRKEGAGVDDIFSRATRTSLDLSTAFGKDLSASSILVGKALNDPVKGLAALNRVGVQFTAGQKKQIEALVDSGKTLEAQKLILGELETQVRGSADAYGRTTPGAIGRMKVALGNLSEMVGTKAAPSVSRLAGKVERFASEMESGRGKGGRFLDFLKDFGGGLATVARIVGRATSAVVKFGAKHPGITKVAGAILGVAVALKALRFASSITGVTSLIRGLGRVAGAARAAGAASGTSMAAGQAGGFAAGTRRNRGRYSSAMRNVMQGAGRSAGASGAASAAGGIAGGIGPGLGRRRGIFRRAGRMLGKTIGLGILAGVLMMLPEISRQIQASLGFKRPKGAGTTYDAAWLFGLEKDPRTGRSTGPIGRFGSYVGQHIGAKGARAHGGMVRGHATGGLVQIGDRNASGGDTVATQIVTGAGEQAAVFTRHQRAVADEALAPMGGLSGLFGGVTQAHSASGAGSGRGAKRFARGGLVGLPGGGKVHRSIRSDVSTLMRQYKLRATDAEDPGGLEVDFEPAPGGSWELLERLAKYLEPRQGSPRSPLNFVGFTGDSGYGRGRGMAVGWEERSGGGSGRLGPLPNLDAPRAARATRTAVAPKNTAREAVRRTASQIKGGGGTRAPGTSSMPGFALDSRGIVHVSTVAGTRESALVTARDRLAGSGRGSIKRASRANKPRLRRSLKKVRNELEQIIGRKARIIPEEEDFASLPQVGAYNMLEGQLQKLATEYGLAERTHNLTDEEFLVTPRPSDPNSEEEVNQSGMEVEGRGFVRGIAQRVSELDELIGRKGSMGEMIGSQSGAAGEVVGELDRRRTQTVGQMAVLKDQATGNARQIETYIKGKEGVERELRRRGHSPAEKTKLRGYLTAWDQKLAPWYRDQVTLTGVPRPSMALLNTFVPGQTLWSNADDSKLGKGSARIKDIFAERSNWAGDGSAAGSRNVARELGFEREALSLDVGELQKEKADVQGTRAPTRTGGGGVVDDGGMADLLREQVSALQASQRVSAAQFDVFRGFQPEMRAAFAKGGIVGRFDQGTDRVEHTGLAMVHRDEQITPDPKGAYGSQLATNRTAAPPQVSVVVEGDVGPLISGVRAYVDGKVAQVSADTGRKGRQLAAAPGR